MIPLGAPSEMSTRVVAHSVSSDSALGQRSVDPMLVIVYGTQMRSAKVAIVPTVAPA